MNGAGVREMSLVNTFKGACWECLRCRKLTPIKFDEPIIDFCSDCSEAMKSLSDEDFKATVVELLMRICRKIR